MKKTQQHKMRFSFHRTAFHFTLLCLIPWTVTSYPVSPTVPLPTVDGPELVSALLHLQAALEDPGDAGLFQPDAGAKWLENPQPAQLGPVDEEDGSWEEEALLRTQRGDVMDRLLSTFPMGDSLQGTHYHEGGEGEDGERRNEALTSIAGGLQAVGREKGGFGFRFGRKRWTDRGSGTDEGGVLNGRESGV
ncbi:hypothetical protein EXN66_Car000163 [Channa argus]|uniref:Uncharacterized protein n=1 Tax=Channa argus TaxID=215402 RepID=A0A6G1QWC1_CHAAH|nr:hypothetical protein EXN66_Car000163 [Channa argus]